MRIKTALEILGRNGLAKAAGVSKQATYNWLVIPYNYQEKILKACQEKEKARKQALVIINKMIKELEQEHKYEKDMRA